MTTDKDRAKGYARMVKRRFAELDKGNFGILDELFDRGYKLNFAGIAKPLDLEATKRFYRALYSAFPDLRHDIVEQISEGKRVTTRWTARGTHRGEWMGVAPTNKKVLFTGINIYTIARDRFTQSFVNWDMFSLFAQLGAMSVRLESPAKPRT